MGDIRVGGLSTNLSMFCKAKNFDGFKPKSVIRSDQVCFSGSNSGPSSSGRYYNYINVLKKPLKANPNPELETLLSKDPEIIDVKVASKRIASLSKYLKETMVGFEVPESNNKQWFEDACGFFIKGSAGINLDDRTLENFGIEYAKDFWGLMAKADSYWLSNNFLDYLNTLRPGSNLGVKKTIEAINLLREDSGIRNKIRDNISFGYDSKLKYINRIIEAGCAYSGEPYNMNGRNNSPNSLTVDHILSNDAGGDKVNLESNYIPCSLEENNKKGNIPLTAYLRGWDCVPYNENNKFWQNNVRRKLQDKEAINDKKIRLSKWEKKEVKFFLKELRSGHFVEFKKLVKKIQMAIIRELERTNSMQLLKNNNKKALSFTD